MCVDHESLEHEGLGGTGLRFPHTDRWQLGTHLKDQIIKGLAGYAKGFAFYSESGEQALIGLTGTGNPICILGPCLSLWCGEQTDRCKAGSWGSHLWPLQSFPAAEKKCGCFSFLC